MRNRNWLRPDYFDCLARRQVTHVFNSCEAMPPVSQQMAPPAGCTNPELVAARFLLKPGRQYEEAVKPLSHTTASKRRIRELSDFEHSPSFRCDLIDPSLECDFRALEARRLLHPGDVPTPETVFGAGP
jgi:hypothetical protein